MRAGGKFLRLGGRQWLLKGVTYGPFAGADSLPPPDQVERDLQQVVALGANTLRLYVPPPPWFLDACASAGLQVLVGWPWPVHTDFLRTRRGAAGIVRAAREVVRSLRGAPAVLGFLVGNEIPAQLVRWMGPDRVQRFLERLIAACRREAPGALFAYASYPCTEYLNPRNADFVVCNIYLEDRKAFAQYLARLQHLAGDRPLVVGEFGLDTRHHGEAKQAEVLAWAWEEVLRAGLAGQVLFGFTDEWFNDGRRLDGEWAFGLTTAGRAARPAATALCSRLPALDRPGQGVQLASLPRFSIIICTYNGSRSLRTALDSVQSLPYADYEVLLIDDGSTDPEVALIAAEYRDVRVFRLAHGGLSKARNFGARQASGSHLVYLDDDGAADGDWLTYLALAFEDEQVGAAGGPNIPPPARTWHEAALAAAPGGPAPVLLNDTEAEHVPGCNLAVTRAAWEEVGGFDERHRTAGDDVDFCWRLLEHGYKIAYHSGAMTWHERRRTVPGYFRQQTGYGWAEAALIAQHPHRFGKLGGARWRGIIYEPTARFAAGGGIIYGGVFGTAPYQFLYTPLRPAWAEIVTSAPWAGLAGLAAVAGAWQPWLLAPAGALLAPAVWLAARTAAAITLPAWPGRRAPGTLAARTLVFLLALFQPWARGAARQLGCLRQRAFPGGPWPAWRPAKWPWLAASDRLSGKVVAEVSFWSQGQGERTQLLQEAVAQLLNSRWPVRLGNVWADWDLEVGRGLWWTTRLITATEYHPRNGRLTRARIQTQATWRTRSAAALTLALVLALIALRSPLGIWALAVTFMLWLALENHHSSIVRRLLQQLQVSGRTIGLHPLSEKPPKKPPTAPTPPVESETET